MTRDGAKAMFEKSAPNYRGVPGLVRKYYLYGDDRTGGGVYLWNSREAAERFYSEAWKSMIAQRYGAQPDIIFYETPVIVDNADDGAKASGSDRNAANRLDRAEHSRCSLCGFVRAVALFIARNPSGNGT